MSNIVNQAINENLIFKNRYEVDGKSVALLVAEGVEEIAGGQCVVSVDLESDQGFIGDAVIVTQKIYDMLESKDIFQEFINDFYTATLVQMGEIKTN